MKHKFITLKTIIYEKYKSEAELAREIGWSRQRLNKITNGKKKPSIEDLNTLAGALGENLTSLAQIFLS